MSYVEFTDVKKAPDMRSMGEAYYDQANMLDVHKLKKIDMVESLKSVD